MAVVGRGTGSSAVEQLAATFNTNITSANVEQVVYFNNGAMEWQLLTGIDPVQLSQNLVGVISSVTVDGDTIGGLGQGFVTIRGSIQKAGAISGQIYFIGTGADLVLTPPAGEAAIRIGYSKQNGFAFIDVDPDTIQIAILQDQINDMQTQLDEIQEQITAAAVYDFGADDAWAVNTETTDTDFGLDDNWTEGLVEYNANFGSDDNWGELIPG